MLVTPLAVSARLRSLTGLGLGAFVDDVRDGLLVIRFPVGNIEMVNRSASEMCGIPLDLVLPVAVNRIFPDPAVTETARKCSQGSEHLVGFWAGHPQEVMSTRIRGRHGYEMDVILSFCRIEDPTSQDPLVLVVVNGDSGARVSVAVAAQAGAQERVEALEAEARKHALFFSQAAHEFNTPLTILGLQVNLLRAVLAPMPAMQEKAIGMMTSSVHRLVLLSQDLADLAKADAGGLMLQSKPVDLTALVAGEVDTFQPLAVQQELTLSCSTPGGSVLVLGDSSRIRQALANFLVNAVKFTPPGGNVNVNLSTANEWATIRVIDTGRGMSQANQELLFRPFSRITEPGQPKKPGTGLGLYLSKRIAEGHGGRVGCSSPGPGQGMTFCLTLPSLR